MEMEMKMELELELEPHEYDASKAAHMSGLMPQVSGKCQVLRATWPPEEEQSGRRAGK